MNPLIIVMAAVVLFALLRLRSTYRQAKKYDRTAEIESRLAALRKKRDEDGESDR